MLGYKMIDNELKTLELPKFEETWEVMIYAAYERGFVRGGGFVIDNDEGETVVGSLQRHMARLRQAFEDNKECYVVKTQEGIFTMQFYDGVLYFDKGNCLVMH